MADPIDPTVPIPVKLFDDVARVLVDGTITPSEIVDIAVKATLHAGKAIAGPGTFALYRIGLGPNKWVYLSAAQIGPVKAAFDAQHANGGGHKGKSKDIPFKA